MKFDEIKKFNFLDTLIDLVLSKFWKYITKVIVNFLNLCIITISSIISIKQPKIKLPRKKNVDKKSIGPLLNFYNKVPFFQLEKYYT